MQGQGGQQGNDRRRRQKGLAFLACGVVLVACGLLLAALAFRALEERHFPFHDFAAGSGWEVAGGIKDSQVNG